VAWDALWSLSLRARCERVVRLRSAAGWLGKPSAWMAGHHLSWGVGGGEVGGWWGESIRVAPMLGAIAACGTAGHGRTGARGWDNAAGLRGDHRPRIRSSRDSWEQNPVFHHRVSTQPNYASGGLRDGNECAGVRGYFSLFGHRRRAHSSAMQHCRRVVCRTCRPRSQSIRRAAAINLGELAELESPAAPANVITRIWAQYLQCIRLSGSGSEASATPCATHLKTPTALVLTQTLELHRDVISSSGPRLSVWFLIPNLAHLKSAVQKLGRHA